MPADRPPTAPRRRRLLAALGGALGLAGCQSLGDATRSTSSTTPRTTVKTTTVTTTTTTQATANGDETTIEGTTEPTSEAPTTRPRKPACPDCTLLSASYHRAYRHGYPLEPLDRTYKAAIAVWTDELRATVDESRLTREATEFLAATDFDREYVVAVQVQQPTATRPYALTRFERDDGRQRLRLEAPLAGVQAERDVLLLVRAPNGPNGTPGSAVARVMHGDDVDITIWPDRVEY